MGKKEFFQAAEWQPYSLFSNNNMYELFSEIVHGSSNSPWQARKLHLIRLWLLLVSLIRIYCDFDDEGPWKKECLEWWHLGYQTSRGLYGTSHLEDLLHVHHGWARLSAQRGCVRYLGCRRSLLVCLTNARGLLCAMLSLAFLVSWYAQLYIRHA